MVIRRRINNLQIFWKGSDNDYIHRIRYILSFQSIAVSLRTTSFNIQNFYMVLAVRWVFCTDPRTDNNLCFIRH